MGKLTTTVDIKQKKPSLWGFFVFVFKMPKSYNTPFSLNFSKSNGMVNKWFVLT